jgi:aldose sugar dehydrogenase
MPVCGNAFVSPRIPWTSFIVLSTFLLVVLSLVTGCVGLTSTPATPPGGAGGGGGTGGGGGGTASDQTLKTEDVATNLEIPWSLAFAPDGRLFFTETPGRIRVITTSGLIATPVLDVSSQTQEGQAGTTGMDLDPNFTSNGLIYLHFCTHLQDGLHCRVARVVVSGNSGRLDTILFDYNTPSGQEDHTGGRLKVGPDHLLYLSTGDHDDPPTSQDINSMNGKMLRMNLDGTPAAGNPFPSAPFVYALGFRDPQGLAWDSSGQLYGTDHGPVSNDEVNIIFAGKNYGWPICVGICNNPAFVDPVRLFSPETVPPSGAMFYHGTTISGWDGSMLFAVLGLANNPTAHQVHRLKFDKAGGTKIVEEQVLWKDKFGRIRDVTEGPDGFLYFSTSNLHTSVTGNPGDDRIIRAHP